MDFEFVSVSEIDQNQNQFTESIQNDPLATGTLESNSIAQIENVPEPALVVDVVTSDGEFKFG